MDRTILLLTIFWTALAFNLVDGDSGNPVVSTRFGLLMGSVTRVKGTERLIHQYLGIPFAKPPLGPLRFSAPQPPEPWTGVRDATQQPAVCLQNVDIMLKLIEDLKITSPKPAVSEDCLYLNIYTPAEAGRESRLPVMIWIHGGSFIFGGAVQYDGSALAAYENVVVVVIQYRLGIMGFFSTGDDHSPGNWGLLDQLASLQWIQENINNFGGDPNSVTIFGESAGGCSVSALIFSPLSRGLFHKAISESGVLFFPGVLTKDVKQNNKVLANVTACDDTDSALFVACMRQKTGNAINELSTLHFHHTLITIDGTVLPRPIEELIKEKQFQQIPYLLGVTNNEFGWLLANFAFPPGWHEGIDRETVTNILSSIPQVGDQKKNIFIGDEYFGDTEDPETIRDGLTEMFGDVVIVKPTLFAASLHRDAGLPVYLYEFSHRPSVYGDSRPNFVKADHADEIGFVFGGCFWDGHLKFNGSLMEEENQLCRTVMSYWANFARNGDPNGAGLLQWPVYDTSEKYMVLNLKQSIGRKLKETRMEFLTKTLPEKLEKLKLPNEGHGEL
uniref:Carboxylic ester hydrolase n=1 Tax=Erpetoichthys calabaricus TaxID=27687 RepID=A0A8C4X709_ERPCA